MLLAVAHYLSLMGGAGYAMIKFMIPTHWQWQWIVGQSSIVLPYILLETTDDPPFLKTMCPPPPSIKEKKEEEYPIPRW